MAKRVFMIAPFEMMTGNLSGDQDLRYRENDNPAFDAPDGRSGARNYVPRYVGARRADGKAYFAVRRKNTAVMNTKTRRTMAILGAIAAIRSALQFAHATDWANLKGIYEYRKLHGWDEAGEGITFNQWIDYWLRRMLQYKMDQMVLTSSGLSVTIYNPFNKYDAANALAIGQQTFAKFNRILTTDSDFMQFQIDGVTFDYEVGTGWNAAKANPNYAAMWTGVNAPSADDAPVTFNGLQVYTSAGEVVKSDDNITPNEKYTTIAPEA